MTGSRADRADTLSLWLLSLGCVFSNVTVFNILEYPANIALCCVVALTIIGFTSRFSIEPRSGLALLVLAGAFSIYAAFSPEYWEAIKSLGQIYLALGFLFAATKNLAPRLDARRLVTVITVLLAGHSILLVSQFIALNELGSFALQNPYGRLSPLGPLRGLWEPRVPYLPFLTDVPRRPNGLFSEPSVAGWVTAFGLAAFVAQPSVFARTRGLLILTLCAGVFSTFSLTGWVILAIVLALATLVERGRRRSRSITGAAIVGALCSVVVLFGVDYLTERVASIHERGGSIDVRFGSTGRLIAESLLDYPFGHPIGALEHISSKSYLVDWAGRPLIGFDNSYYWMAYYFGIFGLIFIGWLVWRMIRLVRERGPAALPLVTMALAAGATGAFLAPQFLIFVAAGFTILKGNGSTASATTQSTNSEHGRLPRGLSRPSGHDGISCN